MVLGAVGGCCCCCCCLQALDGGATWACVRVRVCVCVGLPLELYSKALLITIEMLNAVGSMAPHIGPEPVFLQAVTRGNTCPTASWLCDGQGNKLGGPSRLEARWAVWCQGGPRLICLVLGWVGFARLAVPTFLTLAHFRAMLPCTRRSVALSTPHASSLFPPPPSTPACIMLVLNVASSLPPPAPTCGRLLLKVG